MVVTVTYCRELPSIAVEGVDGIMIRALLANICRTFPILGRREPCPGNH